MNRRLSACVALVTCMSVAFVAPARAQEIHVTSPAAWVAPEARIREQLTIARARAEAVTPFELQPKMDEIRLSRGAKTAIIVTAIVVGALIIVGAVVLAKPGKHLP